MNINEENRDLIENRIPFGLLDKETQERMRAWEHGRKHWIIGDCSWYDCTDNNNLYRSLVYRAKPAPERREHFVNVYETYTSSHATLECARKYYGIETLLNRWKITYDEDGSNPIIEVIEVNK